MNFNISPTQSHPKTLRQILIAIAVACLLCLTLLCQPTALAADLGNGERVFDLQCAGCHANGGNIIRRGKNLKQKALKRNGFDSVETIADLVRNGKNNMSAYKDRLTEAEIADVSAYVLDRAAAGWKS
ncbi:MAG: c-type cytochrome [Geitlerinemataceae cyanobacterium]